MKKGLFLAVCLAFSIIANAQEKSLMDFNLPFGWNVSQDDDAARSYVARSADNFKMFAVRWIDPSLLRKLSEKDFEEDFSAFFKSSKSHSIMKKQFLTVDGKEFYSISAVVRMIDDTIYVHGLYSRDVIEKKICNIQLVSWYDGNIHDADFEQILKSIKFGLTLNNANSANVKSRVAH